MYTSSTRQSSVGRSPDITRVASFLAWCAPEGTLRLAPPYQAEKIQDLSADGDFGPRTEAALEAVQKAVYVTADGSYGPVTRDAMRFITTDGRTCHDYR